MKRPAVVVVGLALLLSGCASATDGLAQAASDAASAVSTAELAMQQQSTDRTFVTTTETALNDAVTALDDASSSAAEVPTSSPADAKPQSKTLAEVRRGLDAVLAAQRIVRSDAGAGVGQLTKAAREHHAITRELETLK